MAEHGPAGRRKPPIVAIVLGLLAALLLAYLFQIGLVRRAAVAAAQQAGLAPAPAYSPALQAFFTTPTLRYPDLPGQRADPPLLARVLADVDAARASVDLAVFDLDLGQLAQALVRAQRRGVVVRLVVDSENLTAPEASEQLGLLQRAGIPVAFDRREPFMHNKFVVIDRQISWLGSWNMTDNDTYRNNNNMLRLASRQVAADYAAEFEQMFGGRFGTSKRSATPYPAARVGGSRVEVYFSPEDGVAQHVLDRLAAARRSIRFMAFSYTSAEIAGAMIERARAGVSVRGVAEAQNATGSRAAYGLLKAARLDVLQDGNCYILHHKVIVVDERTVITGSYNFTASAEESNDENLVIVDDPALAQAFLEEFERVYAQAQAPARCR